MRTPLRYQVSEYDCGPTAILNAFSFLFEREEIPAILNKAICAYTLDLKDKKGNLGALGTSRLAMTKLITWINRYSALSDFKVLCQKLEGKAVTIDKLKNCLLKRGVIIVRSYLEEEHYIIVTKITEKYVYIFDSYYLDKKSYKNNKQVKIIFKFPFNYNRKVNLNRFTSTTKKDFSLGPIFKRECILINRF